jgi:hypothetical protein
MTWIVDVESAIGMELTLNVGWALVVVWMLCVWLRMAPRKSPDRRTQFVALAVVILILLPAISMTDDLQAARNPAEVDTCVVRRDHDLAAPHSIFPVAAVPPAPVFAGLPLGVPVIAAPSHLLSPFVDHPALASIQNRPPPAA